jgi:predicted acylesterase/phospholipase RssA/uncharacterized spore protein YtfJ
LAKPLAEFDKLVAQLKNGSVMGEPIHVGETVIIPFAKIKFGLGGGGAMMGFGGGMGGKTVPLGVLIVEGDDVRAELFPEQEEKPTVIQEIIQAVKDRKYVFMVNGLNIGNAPGTVEELAPLISGMMGQTTTIVNALNLGHLDSPARAAAPAKEVSLAEMKKLVDAKKFAEALGMADTLIAKDPKSAGLHVWKGRIMGSLAQGNPADMMTYGAGAMQEFERRGHTHGRLLGTSAGAITAALLAAGYDAAEMLAALDEKKGNQPVFATFMSQPGPFTDEDVRRSSTLELLKNVKIPLLPQFATARLSERVVRWLARQPRPSHLFSFLERGGWYSADNFLAWLESKLDTGMANGKARQFSRMTLKEFYTATKVDLSLVAADTTAGIMLVLNHRTAPACQLAWAVRMSMSIPLLWQEVVWEAGWGTYLGKPLTGDAIVDGGLLSNFPIELFLSDLSSVTKVMGPKKSEHVLGMLIDETMTVRGAAQSPVAKSSFDFGSLKAIQRIGNLVNTTIGGHDKSVIEDRKSVV